MGSAVFSRALRVPPGLRAFRRRNLAHIFWNDAPVRKGVTAPMTGPAGRAIVVGTRLIAPHGMRNLLNAMASCTFVAKTKSASQIAGFTHTSAHDDMHLAAHQALLAVLRDGKHTCTIDAQTLAARGASANTISLGTNDLHAVPAIHHRGPLLPAAWQGYRSTRLITNRTLTCARHGP